jgi:ankyrin repeat protein
MRQKLTYYRSDLKAPPPLMDAVRWPEPDKVDAFFSDSPDLVWADHLFLAACRVPGYEGHGGVIPEADKRQDDRCKVVELFVKYGADPTVRNNRKVSPLHMACRFGMPVLAQKLIELGAEVNAYDEVKETPLYRAVNPGYTDCVSVLADHGADINFQNRKGLSPLHRAVMRGKREVVPILLTYGALVTLCDKSGKTPADYCRNKKILSMLERHA